MEIFGKFGGVIKGKFMRHRKLAIGGLSVLLALGLVLSGIEWGILPIGSSQHGGLFTIGQHEVVLTIGTAEAATATDFTCDGTADDAQFQLALNTLPNTGGKLEVLGGTYNFTATVSRNIDDITIEGVGIATYFAYNGASAIFSAGSQSGWVFSNFSTDGGLGISIASATSVTVWNVKVGSAYLQNITNNGTYIGAPGTPDYVVGVNTATDDVPGSSGYWVKSGSTGQVVNTTSDSGKAELAMQWANDDLPNAVIHLTHGTFTMSAAFTSYGGPTLEGEGIGLTVIRGTGAGFNIYVSAGGTIRNLTMDGQSVRIIDPYINGNNVTIENVAVIDSTIASLSFSGNVTGTKVINFYCRPAGDSRGIGLNGSYGIYQNIHIDGAGSTTDALIYAGNYLVGNQFIGGLLENCANGAAMYFLGMGHTVRGMTVRNCKNGIYNQTDYGIVSDNILVDIGVYNAIDSGLANHATVVNNTIHNVTSSGINIAGSFCTVAGNTVDNCVDGISVEVGGYNTVIGNTANSSTNAGILIYGTVATSVDYNTIVGNTCINGLAYGIIETPSYCDYNSIQGNICYNNAVANIVATGNHTVVRGNIGYVTENSGTATILSGNITVVVTHGLATTPTFISLTGTQAEVKDCIATSVGATYFTITASANVTDNRTVYWRATVGAGN